MTVYVVTSGEYSDYSINRVFSNRKAGEDYIEWRPNNYYRIEEYELDDDGNLDMYGQEKYYSIEIRGIAYNNGVSIPQIWIDKCLRAPDITYPITAVWDFKQSDETFRIRVLRFIPAANWDEEFYRNKYTKVLYDTAAAVKAMLADGAAWNDIHRYFSEAKFDEYPAD